MHTRIGHDPATLSPAALAEAVARARREAVSLARTWTDFQPGTMRAHRALMEAFLASGDSPGALAAIDRIRTLDDPSARSLAAFLEARVRLISGDGRRAASVLREALSTADPVVLRGNDLGQEIIFDILSGANAFAFVGDVEGAAAVIRIADQLRRLILPPGAVVDAYGDDRVWQSGRLAALHAAVGSPPYELRELWRQVSRVARGSTPRERPILAWAGASAAQGLLVGPAADPAAVDELQQLTGVPPRPEFKALAAIVRHDSAGARRALATRGMGHDEKSEQSKDGEKMPMLGQGAAFAMGDRLTGHGRGALPARQLSRGDLAARELPARTARDPDLRRALGPARAGATASWSGLREAGPGRLRDHGVHPGGGAVGGSGRAAGPGRPRSKGSTGEDARSQGVGHLKIARLQQL